MAPVLVLGDDILERRRIGRSNLGEFDVLGWDLRPRARQLAAAPVEDLIFEEHDGVQETVLLDALDQRADLVLGWKWEDQGERMPAVIIIHDFPVHDFHLVYGVGHTKHSGL